MWRECKIQFSFVQQISTEHLTMCQAWCWAEGTNPSLVLKEFTVVEGDRLTTTKINMQLKTVLNARIHI